MLVVLIGCHEQVLLDFHLANIAPNICLTANHCQNQKLLQCITNKPCVFLSGLLARQQCDSKWSNDCFVSHWRHLFFAGDIRRFIDTLSMLSQATLSELIGKLSISIFRNKKSRLKETSVRTGGTPGVSMVRALLPDTPRPPQFQPELWKNQFLWKTRFFQVH